MKKLIVAGVSVAALAAVPAALAHVEPSMEEAPAGNSANVGFTIGHGCDGSPTKEVTIQIPAGVTSARPRPKAGWKIVITRGTLPEPVKDFAGNTVTKGVLSVTWKGGTLPDDQYDEFELRLGFPSTPGKTIYFPTVQKCAKGVHRWIEIPKGSTEPEEPAPAIAIVKAAAHHG